MASKSLEIAKRRLLVIKRLLEEHVSKLRLRAVNATPWVMAVLLLALVPTHLIQAQTFTTLYNFTGSTDGAYPFAGLIQEDMGNLYGVAAEGGDLSCQLGGNGCGVVFKIDTTGRETVLHRFSGKDGAGPYGTLVRDKEGNLFGTTEYGGDLQCDKYQGSGCGVAFKIDTTGRETVLYVFRGGRSDGCEPYQNLIMDEAGNLYGTTPGCGASDGGMVFKLSNKGKETVLHNFAWSDGAAPSGMIKEASGDFYGLTQIGGTSGRGVLYKLTKAGTLTVLYNLVGDADGDNPVALTMDTSGNFYGTTNQGGSFGGTAWKVSKKHTETILHDFGGGFSDGCFPQGGVVRDSDGNLYGNTFQCGAYDDGIIWKVSKDGTETVLHNFSSPDGANPSGSLLRDANGGLYGTSSCIDTGTACYGTVWAYK
jgi:uncharacterized repeat protein (TIGR03803 family)